MMKLKKLLCTALSVSLLSTAALAVGVVSPLQTPSEAGYEIQQSTTTPLMIWGNITTDGDRTVVKNNNVGATDYPEVVLTISDTTYILDAVTGESRKPAELKPNELVYAYVGPAMTRSIPPITNAHVIICNFPADFGAPILAEVQQVTTHEDGTVEVLTDRDVMLRLNGDTALLPVPGSTDKVALADIQPGSWVLAWYQAVTLSLPGQATPNQVMVFPSRYSGLATLAPEGITLDGKSIPLTAEQTPFAKDGKLMVPVRPIAEALGCQVNWSADAPDEVSVTRDGEVLYTLALGQDAVVEGNTTFLTAEKALGLHHLKYVMS